MDIYEHQLLDEWCEELVLYLEELKDFVMHKGLVCKVTPRREPRIALPISLRGIIIDMYHSSQFSGHLGRQKTTETLKSKFYWKGMDEDIKKYIKKCFTCMILKTSLKRKPGLLKSINPFKDHGKLTPGSFFQQTFWVRFPFLPVGIG